jgi:hypothetical protein
MKEMKVEDITRLFIWLWINFYGPSNKLKRIYDLYHQNGIAVILDVALNHAFGRNPMV